MGITGKFRLVAGVLAAVLCADASADSVIALGPVERVSIDGSVIQVLGQTFTIGNLRAVNEKAQPSGAAEDLRLGTYLYIEGERSPDGTLAASSLLVSKTPYVPGASEVLLAGVVSKFDQVLGVATIGGTQIYVPNASGESAALISEGASLTVVGYQANPRQQIWATEIESNKLISIQGTGKDSIQGTGVTNLSIQGTGKQSIQGTGVTNLSIQGTGKQSIQGTGANNLSIQGTGKDSIQGTGVTNLSIQGTGKDSIQGTGVTNLSIQGTGKDSIQGTGVTNLSIQGTGKQSIQGTGVTNLSIQGTGKQSIQGTGVTNLSIQGTG